MAVNFLYPDYEVARNYDRCISCRACERQCANEVHEYLAPRACPEKCVNENAPHFFPSHLHRIYDMPGRKLLKK